MAKFNKRKIEKRLKSNKVSSEEKNILRHFYLPEAYSNEQILAKLTLKNEREKAIELFGEDGLYFDDLSIYYAVSNFAVLGTPLAEFSKRFRERELRRLVKNGIIKSFEVSDRGVSLVKADGKELSLTLLSSTLLENDEIVGTIERMGRCHKASVDMCYLLPFKTKVVTAYVSNGRMQDRMLHSWLEFEHSGVEFVLDYTMNAYMRKDMYYNLRHVQEVVCEIDGEELKQTLTHEQFEKLADNFDLKIFLSDWHRVKDNLRKNIFLFGEEQEKR